MQIRPFDTPPTSGAGYFFKGMHLIFTPGIRRFVIVPLLINIVLMGGLIGVFLYHLDEWITNWMTMIPSWLHWLSYVLWPLLALTLFIICSYFFSTVSNWIAAPFNGLLSEHLESHLTRKSPPETGLGDAVKDICRSLKREFQKLTYYIPKVIGLFLLMWIPVIGQTLVPLCWFLFNAWMMGIQYCDYPFDNHKVPFSDMRHALRHNRAKTIGFGTVTILFTMIPFVNLFVMPVAVCGATAMWVDQYRHQYARY